MKESVKYIGKIVDVEIDRPYGSLHPKWGFLYEVNYGFIPGTISGDGEELDAYILGINEPLQQFKGEVIAVVERQQQDDDKLIVVEEGKSFTDEEISKMIKFQEGNFPYKILRK